MAKNPDAIATWANAITAGRMLAAPVLFAMIPDEGGSWPAFVAWVILSATDMLDGWLARRHGTTRSGAFLDPLADKVLVLGAMFILVANDVFWLLPVALIAVREIGISLYRAVAGIGGVSVPAKRLAKMKTVTQQVAVGLALAPPTYDMRWLWNSVLWAAVVLTLVTGAQYLLAARAHTVAPTRPGA